MRSQRPWEDLKLVTVKDGYFGRMEDQKVMGAMCNPPERPLGFTWTTSRHEGLSRQLVYEQGLQAGNRFLADPSTSMLASIFNDLEQLWKDIASEKTKLEELQESLAKSEKRSSNQGTDRVTTPLDWSTPAGSECSTNHYHRRKPTKPVRSASRNDPSFRGVTVVMKTKIRGGDSQLVILSTHTAKKTTRTHHPRIRRYSAGTTESSSDSDDDIPPIPKQPLLYIPSTRRLPNKVRCRYTALGGKTCASCATRKTPLWRDAEDGTPLCNACGIRYKKYRVRCSRCWHIPKKDGKTYPHCPCCGSLLSISLSKRAWSR